MYQDKTLILFVDDEPTVLASIKRTLESLPEPQNDLEVRTEQDPYALRTRVQEWRPDIILLDYRFEIKDPAGNKVGIIVGGDLVADLRELPTYAGLAPEVLPVVMYTLPAKGFVDVPLPDEGQVVAGLWTVYKTTSISKLRLVLLQQLARSRKAGWKGGRAQT
jgi:CheY-like chemotaxis protein